MSLCCNDEQRRAAVRWLNGWSGIDYVEVGDDQRSLTVYFLGRLPPELSTNKPGLEAYLTLSGGERITDIKIVDVDPVLSDDPEKDDALFVAFDKPGDFSTYTLTLTGVQNIDPRYGRASFSFKIDCPSDLDCAPVGECAPVPPLEPEISYLAKDYASFRQLILDRMALLVPGWTERHVPDVGVAVVEALAYEGDYLSYYQDAVATEAYLDTARQRVSVRRHARLVDYRMHEGCNARALLAFEVDSVVGLEPARTSFITGLNGAVDPRTVLEWHDLREVSSAIYDVFEPFDRQSPIALRPAHNAIRLHTWGNRECCLEKGGTSAALVDNGLQLAVGDWLIFEEVRGPVTGLAGDADPTHRHAVRLTQVEKKYDPVVRDEEGQPLAYLAVVWSEEDALPFPLCVSAIGAAPRCIYLDDITIARGNVVLVDHGRTTGPEDLGCVPEHHTEVSCVCEGRPGEVQRIAGTYAPTLRDAPLTFREPLPSGASAAVALNQDPRLALPQLWLSSQPPAPWEPRADLVGSLPTDAHFVVEIDNDGGAHLRFGDGELGFAPAAHTDVAATYRTGNGAKGNVGGESISVVVLTNQSLSGVGIRVRNPLPARGGVDPEVMAEAKLMAPYAFRTRIERAIIAEDYEEIAERNARVQRASAELVWTGSWYEADVAIDPVGSQRLGSTLMSDVAVDLDRRRRMGHDLHIEPAVYVAVDLKLDVCVLAGSQAAHVRAALLDVFSNRLRRNGTKGFFHPDNQSFGEGIYLSVIVATARAAPGVASVSVTRLQRRFEPPNRELENGVLPIAANEIAQLDNDPNYPERGRLVITVHGGR